MVLAPGPVEREPFPVVGGPVAADLFRITERKAKRVFVVAVVLMALASYSLWSDREAIAYGRDCRSLAPQVAECLDNHGQVQCELGRPGFNSSPAWPTGMPLGVVVLPAMNKSGEVGG